MTTVSGKDMTTVFACYLLGCFTAGYYWVRWRTGQDIRQEGSGNVGARNAGRILGATAFAATLLLDLGKGALAVGMTLYFGLRPEMVITAMLAVVVGHIWPAQLFFRGGKGVATSLGALVVYDYQLVIAYVVIFAGGFAFTRKTILPGLFAYLCLPIISYWLDHDGLKVGVVSFLSLLVLIAHRNNIVEEIPALAARLLSPRWRTLPPIRSSATTQAPVQHLSQ